MKKLDFFVLIGLFFILGWAFMSGLEKEERYECYKWQRWSQELRVFYLTPWQKAQCDHYGIKIDAPVRGGGH